MNLAYSKLY